jgi:hypothetical protein
MAGENCNGEKSATCDMITNTTPPAPPEWNPAELVAVTMTREEWLGIISWLSYGADWNHARMYWWRECCHDKRVGAETAAKYEAAMLKAESLRQIIEEAIHGE